ncbi:hypothetical protein [Actinomadura yumaensis]|uniref:Uncharacterized protein n=1 Tax=Actinomadura yumaensis TaxID=111807 RepID=A0ABW2CQ18_9ACTN
MSRVELRGDLEAAVARALAGPVQAVTEQVAVAAAENAPEGRTWVTHADERVRPSHVAADAQTIPGNLRFQLPNMLYVRKGRGPDGRAVNAAGGWRIVPGAVDLARQPRDPALPIEQRINCRCRVVVDAGAVAAAVRPGAVRVVGTRVAGDVVVAFPRVAESEFPDPEDGGGGWMRAAARTVAARHR